MGILNGNVLNGCPGILFWYDGYSGRKSQPDYKLFVFITVELYWIVWNEKQVREAPARTGKRKKQEIKVYFEKLHGSDQWRVDHETLSLVFGNNSALIQVRITWVIHPELMIQVKAH